MKQLVYSTIRCTALALLLGQAAHRASAQPIYQTGFEKKNFVAGSPLAGQDGWIAPPPLSPNAAVVTKDKPRLGEQAVRVLGADLQHQDFINELTDGYYDAIGSYRHPVNYETNGAGVVQISASVRVDGERTALGNNFFSAGITSRALLANGDTAGIGELAISSDGHVYGYSGNENVPTFLASTQVELGKLHTLTIIVDFGARTYTFMVDHHILGEFAFDPNNVDEEGNPVDYTTMFLRGTLVAYAAPDTAELKKANYAAFYDQFSITASQRKNYAD
jgi:hypothetical protein